MQTIKRVRIMKKFVDRKIDGYNFKDENISDNLVQAQIDIRSILDNTFELLINTIKVAEVECAIVSLEAMVSTHVSENLIFEPLSRLKLPEGVSKEYVFEYIQEHTLVGFDRTKILTYGELVRFIMSGFACLILDGTGAGIVLGVQGFERRGVSEPETEVNIYGALDGFTETIRVNVSLIRRRLKTPLAKFEIFQLGENSCTDIVVCYRKDKAPQSLINHVKKSLKKIKIDSVLTTGSLNAFLEGRPISLFSSVSTTQRPDVLCSKINEGRVAVFVDGNPNALIVPTLFVENFQTVDDYASRPFYGTYIRWIKYIAFFLATILPGLYVAIVTFHPEMFNQSLLLNLVSSKELTPYSLTVEALIITILYEIMREAGIRLPKAVGSAIGIVGGLIIGDAAVTSGLISAPLLIVLGLTATSSFVVSTLNQQTSILRLLYIIAGGTLGVYGIALIGGLVMFNICAMESYGVPFTAPLSPFTLRAMRDVLVRAGFKKLQKYEADVESLNGVIKYNSKAEGSFDE